MRTRERQREPEKQYRARHQARNPVELQAHRYNLRVFGRVGEGCATTEGSGASWTRAQARPGEVVGRHCGVCKVFGGGGYGGKDRRYALRGERDRDALVVENGTGVELGVVEEELKGTGELVGVAELCDKGGAVEDALVTVALERDELAAGEACVALVLEYLVQRR